MDTEDETLTNLTVSIFLPTYVGSDETPWGDLKSEASLIEADRAVGRV